MDDSPSVVWTVVGGGVAGIASVGRLLEKLPPSKSKIYWIDNRFDIGKMGNYYRAVPANTLNGDLCVAFELCQSFGWNQSQTIRKLEGKVTMQELAFDECFQLSTFVEALEDATSYMMPQCTTVIKGFVRSMQKDNGGGKWKIRIDGDEETLIETDAVIYACGGNASSPLIDSTVARKWSLDVLVDPCFVSKILRERPELINERWVVVGGSHSAMLILMNLVTSGATNIVNIYRSDIRFMHTTEEGYVRYPGTGLKGPVGSWVKENLAAAPVVRIRYNDQLTWDEQLRAVRAEHVVFAIGFKKVDCPSIQFGDKALTDEDLDCYDKMTGEIFEPGSDEHIFADHVDGGGRIEPWVGFKRSIEQVDLMIEALGARVDILESTF